MIDRLTSGADRAFQWFWSFFARTPSDKRPGRDFEVCGRLSRRQPFGLGRNEHNFIFPGVQN